MQFLTDINLNGNQLLNATIQNVAVDPSNNLVEGKIIYNTAEKKMKYYDGTQWSEIGSVEITIDDTVTEGSTNAVQSGAVKTYVDTQVAGLAKSMTFKGTITGEGSIVSSDEDINGKSVSELTGYKTGWVFVSQSDIKTAPFDTNPLESGDMIVFINDCTTTFSMDDISIVQANIDTSTFALKSELEPLKNCAHTINQTSSNILVSEDTSGDIPEYKFDLTKKLNKFSSAGPFDNITITPEANTVPIPHVTVDEFGRISSIEDKTLTIPVSTIKSKTFTSPALTPSGGVASWTVEHNLGTDYPNVTVYEASSKEVVIVNIVETDSNTIKISINSTSSSITESTYVCRISG